MTVTEIIRIGFALAMDAFALTIANCATYGKTLNPKKEWSMPIVFAVFQFAMPVAGYYIGSLFAEYIGTVSKFITAAIFFALSLKIIIDNLKKARENENAENDKSAKEQGSKIPEFSFLVLIIQAVATSIDALVIGITFAVDLEFSVFAAAAIIGAVTFAVVAAALMFGKYLDKLFGKYAEWLGAVILLALAIKNLIEGIVA